MAVSVSVLTFWIDDKKNMGGRCQWAGIFESTVKHIDKGVHHEKAYKPNFSFTLRNNALRLCAKGIRYYIEQ